MRELLWMIPFLPFAGFVALVFGGGRLEGKKAAVVGVGSVALSMIVALVTAIDFLTSPPPSHSYSQTLWTWMHVGNFRPAVSFYLDALSLLMVLVVTVVGFLIHLYSAEFMSGEEGYRRFFAYMNLFVGAMLTLVLADNLFLLYLGWEGVGLCSYLLIGFWYKDPVNGRAARKAFLVTRIGDVAFIIGLFLLFTHLGTLQIQEIILKAGAEWPAGSGLAIAASALLLGGAVGKSAQLPLQTWLPDAMAGPTPVSALIHAATMVTAGVYLIARTNSLFTLAPAVQSAVAVIGAATLLLAGFSALTQRDIKRILAYSTISQIGYMFLALGVGAWSAAMFHFMTHAFFKALLFLSAGVVILGLEHEHDIFKMGGLRRQLPLAFWSFLIGASSLSSLPLVTAGFYSKDLILYETWSSGAGGHLLWAAGLAGAFLTSLYAFRTVFVVFFGEPKSRVSRLPGKRIMIPVSALAVLSLVGGFVELPPGLGNVPLFSKFMGESLPQVVSRDNSEGTEMILRAVAGLVSLTGVGLACLIFLIRPRYAEALAAWRPGQLLYRLWSRGWGFDLIYDRLIVRPFVWAARINKDDMFDLVYLGAIWISREFNRALSLSQAGKVRWYATGIVIGAILMLAVVVLR